MAEISSDANDIERSLALTRTTDLPQLDTDELPPREMTRTSELDAARETVDLQTEDVTAESSSSLQIGLSYRVGFTLASMVAGLSSMCIKQLLLPLQVSFIAPHSTNTSLYLERYWSRLG